MRSNRNFVIDILRGIAIFTMVAANISASLLQSVDKAFNLPFIWNFCRTIVHNVSWYDGGCYFCKTCKFLAFSQTRRFNCRLQMFAGYTGMAYLPLSELWRTLSDRVLYSCCLSVVEILHYNH